MGFFDSEMERSFLKTAKKKGWVKDEPKQEIVRTASVKLAATGNVDVDVCMLINALKEKGFDKQASSLESSFIEYKRAENQYRVHAETGEDLIEAAHPDGDARMFDSAEGLGAVETGLSAQKKIVDIARKEPVKSSIASAASFFKSAQEGRFDVTNPSASSSTGGSSDRATVYYLEKVKNSLNALASEIDKAQQMNFDNAINTYLYSEAHKSSLFIGLKGNYDKLNALGRVYYVLGNDGSAEAIYKAILSNPNSANDYLSRISKELGGQYKIAALNEGLIKEAQSPYGMSGQIATQEIDRDYQEQNARDAMSKKAWPVARQISNDVATLRRGAEDEIYKVNEALETYKKQAASLSEIIKQMAQQKTSTPQEIAVFADNLEKGLPSLYKNIYWPARLVAGSGQDASMISRHFGDVKSYSGNLTKAAKSGVKDAIDEGRVRATIGRLNSILKKINSTEAAKERFSPLSAFINRMKYSLENNVGAGFEYLKSTNPNFKKFKDYDSIDRQSMTVESIVDKFLRGEK